LPRNGVDVGGDEKGKNILAVESKGGGSIINWFRRKQEGGGGPWRRKRKGNIGRGKLSQKRNR